MDVARWVVFIGVGTIATLTACGESSSPPTPTSTSSPDATYTAVPQATLAPFTESQAAAAVPVPTSTDANTSQITLSLPSTADVVNEMDLTAAGADIPTGTTVDEAVTNEALTDAPAPTSALRNAAAVRIIDASKAVKTHIETVSVKFSKRVSLKTRPTFVFTFAPGFLTTANYYLQYYDTSQPDLGWQDPFEGPATISGSTLLFVDTKNAFTFSAGVKYYFDLYAVSVKFAPTPIPATPTPAATGATAAPLPTPSPIFGLLTVTPPSFAFDAAGQTQTLDVSEDGYLGTFTAKIDNSTIATIASPSRGLFVVTASANAGASAVTVTDDDGQSVRVPFTVTITTGTISSRSRPSHQEMGPDGANRR